MDGRESMAEICLSPESLPRVEGGTGTISPTEELSSNRPFGVTKRQTKSPSVSFDIQDSTFPRDRHKLASAASAEHISSGTLNDTPRGGEPHTFAASAERVSPGIQDDTGSRGRDTLASAASAERVSSDNQDDALPQRTETFASFASSILDPAWVKQHVLSFGLYTRHPLPAWRS